MGLSIERNQLEQQPLVVWKWKKKDDNVETERDSEWPACADKGQSRPGAARPLSQSGLGSGGMLEAHVQGPLFNEVRDQVALESEKKTTQWNQIHTRLSNARAASPARYRPHVT